MTALHCRAILLLQKEYFKLSKLDLWGIEVAFDEDVRPFQWDITLSGLKNTQWEGAKLYICIKFTEFYNEEPPTAFFIKTIPVHPNVDPATGQICLGCLEQWNSATSLASVLLSIQVLLSEPCLEHVWNNDAAKLMKKYPLHYKQRVMDCVVSSEISQYSTKSSSISPSELPKVTEMTSEKEKSSSVNKKDENSTTMAATKTTATTTKQLSYDNYLDMWRAVATTQPDVSNSQSIMDLKEKYSDCKPKKDGLGGEFYRQFSDHQKLMYGSFSLVRSAEKEKSREEKLKAKKIKLLKDIHMNRKGLKNLHVSIVSIPSSSSKEECIINNKEERPVETPDLNSEDDQPFQNGNEMDREPALEGINTKELLEWSNELPDV